METLLNSRFDRLVILEKIFSSNKTFAGRLEIFGDCPWLTKRFRRIRGKMI
jgi:hypothetical protein